MMDKTALWWSAELVREIHITNRVVHVDLCYPRSDDHPHTIEVGLCDVRAGDDVRLSYDFDRDGWKIEQQAQEMLIETNGRIHPATISGEWQEVAFVKSWALTTEHREEDVSEAAWLERYRKAHGSEGEEDEE